MAALAGTSQRDSAATISAMSFIRSMATAVSVVVGGVIFQNEMAAASPNLIASLGEELAREFNGGQAAATVNMIATLPEAQQSVVRRAYYDGLRKVWIMVRMDCHFIFSACADILLHPVRCLCRPWHILDFVCSGSLFETRERGGDTRHRPS